MSKLSFRDIEARVAKLREDALHDREFIFAFLAAYGRSKSNISRLKSSQPTSLNIASNPDREVAQKGVLYFREYPPSTDEVLLAGVKDLSADPLVVRYKTRFVIVTDYQTLLAKDVKTGETLITQISQIVNHVAFFLPWAGMEKAQFGAESHADVRAAERMAKLFDELTALNPYSKETFRDRHALNTFFSRLLFCFFAEDTGVFNEGQFTTLLASVTQDDGSDLKGILEDLFTALDTQSRDHRPEYLRGFPYVNGQLFRSSGGSVVPAFNRKARRLLLESGGLNWSEINPDIFGSMFQAIVTPGQRSELGQHYTSVPNILKTIEPLFLDHLRNEFDESFDSVGRLESLLKRVARIVVFDPACGSGNFLVIAYKELRKLEHAILERLGELRGSHYGLFDSVIGLENFFGIEIDDFAAEIAVLSLWIAKHQMNIEFEHKFGSRISLIPLTETGNITLANANRIDWNTVCPNDGDSEIYLIGNPPYKGAKKQSPEMKADFAHVFGKTPFSRNLDYVALWFFKGAEYIKGTRAQLSFVATSSVSQGEHVGLMFQPIFDSGLEIGYAYTPFRWVNNAKNAAGVMVIVVNLRVRARKPKFLYTGDFRLEVGHINGYLADAPDVFLSRRSAPLCPQMPTMVFGSMARDGGGLILSADEYAEMSDSSREAQLFLKKFVGTEELLSGESRYCLWIEDHQRSEAESIPAIADRINAVQAFRSLSKAGSTAAYADRAHRFVQISHQGLPALVVPKLSTERRQYLPVGSVDSETVVSDLAFSIYGAETWVLAILVSKMHMVWTKAVAGALGSGIRYSNTIVWNNFPVPTLSVADKQALSDAGLRVLDVREYHPELSLSELYDPKKMPEGLALAHLELDQLVDLLYQPRGFESDAQRLSFLFKMFTELSELEVLA